MGPITLTWLFYASFKDSQQFAMNRFLHLSDGILLQSAALITGTSQER